MTQRKPAGAALWREPALIHLALEKTQRLGQFAGLAMGSVNRLARKDQDGEDSLFRHSMRHPFI
jgi:hypothetical protein